MLFGPDLLHQFPSSPATADQATTLNTFGWLVILGFPIEIAAAKAMPELFTEKPQPQTDGRRSWAR
jgi:hypothetical protein